jgi:hypothetical protein
VSIPKFSYPLKLLQGIEKMVEWPKVLDTFRNTVSVSSKPSNLSADHISSPFRLLRLIERNNKNKNYNAIESNFLYAALHIACMKELRFSKEMCPDLPDDLDGLART